MTSEVRLTHSRAQLNVDSSGLNLSPEVNTAGAALLPQINQLANNLTLWELKVEDLQPIRDAYENELAQARKVIDELSSNKGVAEAKVVGLQDEIARLNEL